MILILDDYFSIHEVINYDPENSPPPITNQSILRIDSTSSEESALIRLLIGSTSITHIPSNLKINQRTDHSILGTKVRKKITSRNIEVSLNKRSFDVNELNHLLRKTLNQRAFYKELLLEATHYFYRTKLNQHCMAFLHLYRFLERISFCFPVIYASASDNFLGVFDSLKEYIGDAKTELKFFNNFTKSIIDKDILENTNTPFDIAEYSPSEQLNITNAIKKALSDQKVMISSNNGLIEIQNIGLIDLTIGLRNRFFHQNSSHKNNISLTEISNPDMFFSIFNKQLFNWLIFIYFEILEVRVSKYR